MRQACSVTGPAELITSLGALVDKSAAATGTSDSDEEDEVCGYCISASDAKVAVEEAQLAVLQAASIAEHDATGIPAAASGSSESTPVAFAPIDLKVAVSARTWPCVASDSSGYWQFCSLHCRDEALRSMLFVLDYDFL